VFRPERWLEAIDEDDNNKSREACLMPFGLGSRTCIGKNISLLEINKLIPVLVRDYDFEFVAKDGSAETNGAETSQYLAAKNRWFVKPSHLHARVMKRRGDTTSL
jgi:cytochrome P450